MGLCKFGWAWSSLKIRGFPKRVVFQKGGLGGCSPGRKTGTRVRSHVPPERKPERGYIRQNHPFTKPRFCLPVTNCPFYTPRTLHLNFKWRVPTFDAKKAIKPGKSTTRTHRPNFTHVHHYSAASRKLHSTARPPTVLLLWLSSVALCLLSCVQGQARQDIPSGERHQWFEVDHNDSEWFV